MAPGQPVYRVEFLLQLSFYALSFIVVAQMKKGLLGRMADRAFPFVVLNTAAVVAFAHFVTGRRVAWNH
jgi:hypothetical protein